MDLDDDFFGLNKEPVTAVSKNKKSILDSSDDEDGEPSFSFLKTDNKKGICSEHNIDVGEILRRDGGITN